jgi:predicted DCC family thiol-disulfide oxidoreductase YuxK
MGMGPRGMIEHKRAYMLFDGDCGICTWFADFAMRTDVLRYFYVEPYQQVPEPEIQQFALSHADCARRLRVITRSGKVHSGAFAVNYFFIHYFPWNLLVVVLYVVTPLLLLEIITYELVARNRARLSRWLGMKACLAQK